MKRIIIGAIVAVLATFFVATPSAAATQHDPAPSCHTATFSENSGNGPTYRHVHFCDALNKGVNQLIVDGGPLKSGATVFGSHESAARDLSSIKAGLSNLKQCFGDNGIHESGLIMGDCINQSGPGGATYWSFNESNYNTDKHPSSGLLWTEASTLYPTPDANPPNPYQDFWVGIAHKGGTFCTVVSPGEGQKPHLCEFTVPYTGQTDCSAVVDPGGGQPKVCFTVKIMSPRRQASYDQLIQGINAAHFPDCAYSMTITGCDTDS